MTDTSPLCASALCPRQLAVPSDWKCSASEQSRLLTRWQTALSSGGGAVACVCAACLGGLATDDAALYDDVVGGLPLLPRSLHCHSHSADSTQPRGLSWPCCPLCQQRMLFLLQLHTNAPAASAESSAAEEQEAEEEKGGSGEAEGSSRFLLFFCCSDEACELAACSASESEARSRWRVWRLIAQAPTTPPAPMHPAATSQQQQPVGSADSLAHKQISSGVTSQRLAAASVSEDSDWGAGAEWDTAAHSEDSSGRSGQSGGGDGSGGEDGELSARLEQLILQRRLLAQAARTSNGQQPQTLEVPAPTAVEVSSTATSAGAIDRSSSTSARPAIPSSAASTPPFLPRCARPFYLSWSTAPSAAAAAAARPSDEPHVQRLLRDYQQSERSAAESAQASPAQSPSAVDASYVGLGDEYEPSAGSAFARFRRQLSLQPQQRIRYQSQPVQRLPAEQATSSERRGWQAEDSGGSGGSDSSSDERGDGASESWQARSGRRDECLAVDGRMRRAMSVLSRAACEACGELRSFECQLLGSLVSDLVDVSSGQPIALGWTTAALYSCRNTHCAVGQLVDETSGLLVAS